MRAAPHGPKVIWNTMMSLDGFVADPDETMQWAFEFDAPPAASVAEVVARLGALVVGRRTMDVEDRRKPGFYGGAFQGPFFVATSDRDRPTPIVKGVPGTLAHGPIEEVVATARKAAGDKDVAILGGSVARACLEADLLDEIIVFVAPTLLGAGLRLFEGSPRRLDLLAHRRDGEFVTLTFSPRQMTG